MHVVTNGATISAVDELIQQMRRITTREIADELSISKCTSRNQQKDGLWESLCTADDQASVRRWREWVFAWPICWDTRGKEWISLLRLWHVMKFCATTSTLPWMSMEWPHPSLCPKKPTLLRRPRSFFFDEEGPPVIDWLQRGATVNAERYYSTLLRFKQTTKNKRRGKLLNGIVLLQTTLGHMLPWRLSSSLKNFDGRSCNILHTVPISSRVNLISSTS